MAFQIFNYGCPDKSRVELCISSFYTYDTSIEIAAFKNQEKPADLVINFFPYKEKSILLMGYHKLDEKKVKGYFNAIFIESEKRIQRLLTNLILFYVKHGYALIIFIKLRLKGMSLSSMMP